MSTQKYYDILAAYYDSATKEPGAWLPNDYLLKWLKKFLNSQLQSALDLGAGTGQTTEVIRQLLPDTSITAVDFSKPMLDSLSQKHPDVTVINADIVEFTQTTKASWSLVTAIGSLEFVPRLPWLINRICADLLAPGGLVAFTYEPLISGSVMQGKRKVKEQAGTALGNEMFTVFRYTPASINKVLHSHTIVKLDEEFVAYQKGEQQAIYHLIIAQKILR